MNESIQRETEWAFIAGLIDASPTGIYVVRRVRVKVPQYEIRMKIRILASLAPRIKHWLIEQGRKIHDYCLEPVNGKATPYWVAFVGNEVGEILAMVFPYLISDHRRAQAKLAFQFCRTIPKQGVELAPDERKEREKVWRELKALNEQVRA